MNVSGTLATNTDTTEVLCGASPFRLHLSGTFAAGTVTLKFKDEAGTYHDYAGLATTGAVDQEVKLHQATTVKATLTGATSTPAVFYQFSSESGS